MTHYSIKVVAVLTLASMFWGASVGDGLARRLSDEETADILLNLSLEELAKVKVTSVSKREETAFEAPAAVYVISNEDIARSGATTIPDALRLAPGVQVAQAGSSRWSVSTRGFNGQFSNKLLVLIDGRTIYTPIFSGVYWDQQDTVLEDVERIEVIRGPGATLWGANAVNGVINIITKHARETQGSFVSTRYGNHERGSVTARNGGDINENTYYRVYAKHTNRDSARLAAEQVDANDEWSLSQAGFRVDVNNDSSINKYTLQGDIYSGEEELDLARPSLNVPFVEFKEDDEEIAGGNLLFKWDHKHQNDSTSSFQVYYDIVNRSGVSTTSQDVRTFDIDYQHNWLVNKKNELTWGLGFRSIKDKFEETDLVSFRPLKDTNNLYNAFIQDKITIVPRTVYVTVGSKFEYNNYTDFEYQPSIRANWLPDNRQAFWASIARAVRLPNRAMQDVSLAVAGTPIGYARSVGNDESDSEDLIAYEIGYRAKPKYYLLFDVSLFYNDYKDLASNEILNPITVQAANDNKGYSFGGEALLKWDINENWKTEFIYSYINVTIDGRETGVNAEGQTPFNQFTVKSNYKINDKLKIDNYIYYVDGLNSDDINDYTRVDTQLSWEPREDITLSMVGQNLLDDYHQEFSANINEIDAEIGRSIYGKITWQF